MASAEKRVRVVLRVRPPLEREKFEGQCVRKVEDTSISLINDDASAAKPQTLTTVDSVFDEGDDQRTVYEEVVQELIDHSLDGCNSTIFAYGQTGSGKTHTILGETINGVIGPKTGIFLRVFDDLFHYRDAVKARSHVIISLSAIELYMDDVFDLLNQKNLIKIREKGEDTLLPGVFSFAVSTMADVMSYFTIANSFRSVAATKMNDESSRSHAVFLIDVFTVPVSASCPQPPTLESLVGADGASSGAFGGGRARISLVDLAGSERTKKSGVSGAGLQEANAINKSLTTLRTVIHSMYSESQHIPYRDSKLTKLLRPSFTDPTSRLLLIGQLSPCSESYSESKSTVGFCDEVKGLKVSARSPYMDPEEENQYLAVLRQHGELTADLRICALQNFNEPQFVRRYAKKHHISTEAAIEQLKPTAASRAALHRQHEESQVQIDAEVACRQEMDALVSGRRNARNNAAAAFEKIKNEVAAAKDAWAKEKQDAEERTEKLTIEAKKMKKSRLRATEKVETARAKAAQAAADLQAASSQTAKKPAGAKQSLTPEELEEDEDWEAFEEDWHIAECNHAITEDFHRYFAVNTGLRTELLAMMGATEQTWDKVDGVRTEAASVTLGDLVPDVIHFCVDRSVDIVEGAVDAKDSYTWFDINGSSKKFILPDNMNLPLLITLETYQPPTVVIDPSPVTQLSDDDSELVSSRKGSTVDVKAAGAAAGTTAVADPAKEKKEKKKKKSAVTKKYDSQEADKIYLKKVYDSKTLVQDVLRYLVSGTAMEKHGRSGSPHERRFSVTSSGAREIVWVDPAAPPGTKRSSLPLAEAISVTLGPFSKVFGRHTPKIDDPRYWRSFTISFRDGRTMDIIASQLVDFEAWVLGLVHIIRVDPFWGKKLDVKQDPIITQLNSEERVLCEDHHIWPREYQKVKSTVIEHRTEVEMHMRLFGGDAEHAFDAMGGIHVPQINHKGAVLMTKGELRYHCSQFEIDIFRVCKMWEYFAKCDIVYDPSYTSASSFGVLKRQ